MSGATLVKMTVAGVVGGVIGSGVWAGIAHFTGYEIGWIAIGVGALVGGAMQVAGQGHGGSATGAIAAVIALLSVLGGKYAALQIALNSPLTEENYVSYLADEVITSYEEDGVTIRWPSGVDPEQAWEQADYPRDVWAEAASRWQSMSDTEREDFRATTLANLDLSMEVDFSSSFELLDIVFFGLAIVVAYKLGGGAED